MKTIAVDFDGVIHAYSRGWADGTIYDPPLPGAIEGLHQLMKTFAVYILTSREAEQVMPWLEGYAFDVTTDDRCGTCLGENSIRRIPSRRFRPPAYVPCADCHGTGRLRLWNHTGQLLVTDRKLPALAYADDRAIPFTNWEQLTQDVGRLTA